MCHLPHLAFISYQAFIIATADVLLFWENNFQEVKPLISLKANFLSNIPSDQSPLTICLIDQELRQCNLFFWDKKQRQSKSAYYS